MAEIVQEGTNLERAREPAALYLEKPEVTHRNTRVLFSQPMKEEIVARGALRVSLQEASMAALVESMSSWQRLQGACQQARTGLTPDAPPTGPRTSIAESSCMAIRSKSSGTGEAKVLDQIRI